MAKTFTRRWRRAGMSGLFCLLAVAFSGCQPLPETAHIAVDPHTAPVRTITSFNEALHCMDGLFLANGKKDIFITSAGIPDATGMIAAGTKEMLITAIATMSERSGAFRFVDFDPTQLDVEILSELVGIRPEFVAPSYYIRGAITQLDSSVLTSSESAALSLPRLDLAVSRDQIVSVMSVDLNLGKLVTRQILPGMSASNSIAVIRSDKEGNVGGLIGKAGLSLNVSLDRSEGFHQAVRTLIELSTIEALGKLAHVPYWQCLQIDQTNPTYKTEARTWFDTMSEAERVRFAKAGLSREGYYNGPQSDEADPALSDAVARYQAEHDLVPNGRLDFDLYYRLLSAGKNGPPPTAANAPPAPAPAQAAEAAPAPAAEAAAAQAAEAAAAQAAEAAAAQVETLGVQLSTDRGEHPRYQVNEALVIEARTSGNGFLYCYYQDGDGAVARIFPNRFQPNAFVQANQTVEIPPGPRPPFAIRFDRPDVREGVTCIASPLEYGLKLPPGLKAQDLAPLPVHSLDEVVENFRHIGGNRIRETHLPIQVVR